MFEPASVTSLPEYRLGIIYKDGVQGEVDLSHLAGHGVFSVWQDSNEFDKVSIGDHGQLHWTAEIELCSDSLYLRITGKTVDDAFTDGTGIHARSEPIRWDRDQDVLRRPQSSTLPRRLW